MVKEMDHKMLSRLFHSKSQIESNTLTLTDRGINITLKLITYVE